MRSSAAAVALVGIVLLIGILPTPSSAGTGTSLAAGGALASLNISATGALSFVPSEVTVPSGSTVHLTITQLANFNHTFTLGSEVGVTIPASDSPAQLDAYLAAHPPLVNLSLGATPGERFYANFTAPADGVYEFFCVIPTHFQAGMHGTFTVGTSSTAGSSGSFPTLWVVIGAAVVIAVAAAVLLIRRRAARPPAPTPGTPPSG